MLASADGMPNVAVAAKLDVDQATVRKWRRRFLDKGTEGLADEPRPGVPRKFGDDEVEALIVKTLTEKPTNACRVQKSAYMAAARSSNGVRMVRCPSRAWTRWSWLRCSIIISL